MINSGLRVPIPVIPMPALAVPYAAPTAVVRARKALEVIVAESGGGA